MRLQDFYPIVVTGHMIACRDFYRRWIGLEVVFEASWFVLLGSEPAGKVSLASCTRVTRPPRRGPSRSGVRG